MDRKTDVRPSPIAGQWYPADPKQLAAEVDRYVRNARLPELEGEVVAVMTPHAGIRYSGPVAGFAFAALSGQKPDIVAVVSPLHYPSYYPILSTAHSGYATPLGTLYVDEDALKALDAKVQKELGVGIARIRMDPEHSLEIELPFLQRVIENEFRLLPVMVQEPSLRVARSLGAALASVLAGRNAILVASTDLSHFYPQNIANTLDGEMLRRVEALDPESILQAEEQGKGFACGRGALAAVMFAAQGLGADSVRILNYATSGDVTGDYSQVVGYGAAAMIRKGRQLSV